MRDVGIDIKLGSGVAAAQQHFRSTIMAKEKKPSDQEHFAAVAPGRRPQRLRPCIAISRIRAFHTHSRRFIAAPIVRPSRLRGLLPQRRGHWNEAQSYPASARHVSSEWGLRDKALRIRFPDTSHQRKIPPCHTRSSFSTVRLSKPICATPNFPHSYKEYAVTSEDEIVDRLERRNDRDHQQGADARSNARTAPKSQIDRSRRHGTDVVDKAYCKAHGIIVSNIRNYAFNTVPEHVFALAFALRRNLLAYRDDVRAGRWQECDQFCFFDHPIRDMTRLDDWASSAMARSAKRWRGSPRPLARKCWLMTSSRNRV